MTSYRRFVVCAAAVLVPGVMSGQAARTSAKDVAAVTAAVDRFHSAILSGDTATVAGVLAEDATILESGEVESRAEYLAHHLHEDIQFAKAVPSKRQVKRIVVQGEVAWVTASSASNGTFQGREVHSEGAELMVLRRSAGGWKIAAIHWSSHRARTGTS